MENDKQRARLQPGSFVLDVSAFIGNIRTFQKILGKSGEALLNALIKVNVIYTGHSKLKVVATVDRFGTVYCQLEGGTTFDKSTFVVMFFGGNHFLSEKLKMKPVII